MNYKAIVLDLDGTLMTSKNVISPKTKHLLLKIQRLGIKVILASGRPTKGMRRVCDELQLAEFGGFLLSYNGGRIIDVKTNDILFDSYLEQKMIFNLYDMSRKLSTHIIAYTDDFILTEDMDEYIQLEARINEMTIKHLQSFKDIYIEKSVKCLMTANPNHLEEVEKKLKQIYKDTISISRSMPFFLEFMPKGINKGACLLTLLNHLNIKKEEVIACGDGYNDISLIESVPFGVAMGNGCKEIKKKAKYITYTNDQEGIAHVVEKFIINQ